MPPSCAPGGPGLTDCGSARESCCTSLEVTGGTYYRTYDPLASDGGVDTAADGGPAAEADPASVSAFRLDKYEVTVGRFRRFVNAWDGGSGLDGGAGYEPPAGSGKHTHLNGGLGLSNVGDDSGVAHETGWIASDDGNIGAPLTDCPSGASQASYATWTTSAGPNENLPINCVNWYEAYAFCIWDGGFLPSEAEWEYAAAGGSQQREYPWGSTDPGMNNQYAIYSYYYSSASGFDSGRCTGAACLAPVGTRTLGAGLWGQLDLAGNVDEWTLDWYANSYVDPCTDCAYLTEPVPPASVLGRVVRGGNFGYDSASSELLASEREADQPPRLYSDHGFRCARTP
jgi:formylglycine-generating enzyme required for sulfatase activity